MTYKDLKTFILELDKEGIPDDTEVEISECFDIKELLNEIAMAYNSGGLILNFSPNEIFYEPRNGEIILYNSGSRNDLETLVPEHISADLTRGMINDTISSLNTQLIFGREQEESS